MLDKTIYYFYLFILIFTPLAFGSVEPWSLALMELTIFLMLLLLFYRNTFSGRSHFYDTPGITPLLLLLLYILIHLVPMPQEIIRLLSPETYTIYKETAGQADASMWFTLSLDKKAGISEFFKIASYVAFYFITVQLLSDRNRFKRTMTIVISFASLYAFFAILQHSLPNGKIYWLRTIPQGGLPFGSYINKNHYAGLMEMIFPLAIALFLYAKPEISYGSLMKKFRELLLHRGTNDHILFGLASTLIALSIFLSISRGAILSLSLAMFLMGIFIIIRQRKLQNGAIIAAISVFILFIVGWFGWDPIFARFHAIRDSHGNIAEMRPHIWQDVSLIIKDFSMTGTGFGSFASVYPKYRSILGHYTIDRAHNDYLEFMSNGGIVAFLLIFSFLLSLFYKSYRSFIMRRNNFSIYLYIGSITGLASIMIHSFTDFNLHIGANGLYFFFLAGIAVTSSTSRLSLNSDVVSKKSISFPAKSALLPLYILFFTCFLYKLSIFMGNIYLAKAKGYTIATDKKESSFSANERLRKAIILNPFDSKALSLIADSETKNGAHVKALEHITSAVNRDPLNAALLQQKGLILSRINDKKGADIFIKMGVFYEKNNPIRHQTYAFWLLSENRDEEAAKYLRTLFSLEPEHSRKHISYLILNERSLDYISHVLPDRVEPNLHYAKYLDDTGSEERALEVMINSINFIKNKERENSHYFSKVYSFLKRKKKYNHALIVMRKGIELFPDDHRIRYLTAQAYEGVGIKYRAIEEYKRVLILDPGNEVARKRIEFLEGP